MSNTINCIIVDDEPLAINVIKRYVQQMPSLNLVATCENALEAFEVIRNETVDLAFLDINMPLLTGIEFVKSLQNPPAVIFTTAYRNYAVESYELNVVDYLLKPITFIRFVKAVDKFQSPSKTIVEQPKLEQSFQEATDHIYVNTNKKNVKVIFDQVLYVESIKDYIRIHLPGKNIITKEKISDFDKKLPSGFLRIHRSFIVNTAKITAFTSLDVEIGEKEIPIGGSYKKVVVERLKSV